MKLFTDPNGKFQMLIPVEWEYKNPVINLQDKSPHAFGMYDNMIGAFQLSCKIVNEHLKTIIQQKKLPIQKSTDELQFDEVLTDFDGVKAYMWSAAVEDHFILATYIIEEKIDAIDELSNVKNCLSTFKYILPEFKDKVLAIRRYNLFMAAMAANIDLRNKALENGSFIELVILTANRIDALLRLSLILSSQIKNKNKEIDISILFQSVEDKIITEKKIYENVFNQEIIDQSVYNELELLYLERNKVVHRYIITDIRTEHVLNIAYQYSLLEAKIELLVNSLEYKQYELNIGINAGEHPPGEKLNELQLKKINSLIRDKHGHINWKNED